MYKAKVVLESLHHCALCMGFPHLVSRMKEVDLTFSYFCSYFIFDLFSFILFLELGLRLE